MLTAVALEPQGRVREEGKGAWAGALPFRSVVCLVDTGGPVVCTSLHTWLAPGGLWSWAGAWLPSSVTAVFARAASAPSALLCSPPGTSEDALKRQGKRQGPQGSLTNGPWEPEVYSPHVTARVAPRGWRGLVGVVGTGRCWEEAGRGGRC